MSPWMGVLAPPSRWGEYGGRAHPVLGLSRGVGSSVGSISFRPIAIEETSAGSSPSRLAVHTWRPPEGPETQVSAPMPCRSSRAAHSRASCSAWIVSSWLWWASKSKQSAW